MKEVVLYNGKKQNIVNSSVAVDPDKFKNLMGVKELDVSMVCNQLGYSASTLSSALNYGVFSRRMVVGLKTFFDIDQDQYRYLPPKEEEPAEEPKAMEGELTVTAEDTALYSVMKTAMLDALNEAIAGQMRNLRGMVMSAIRETVRPIQGGNVQ